MPATFMKTAADLRRRKLQSVVLALVLFLAGAASTLALDILVASRAPFEAAFARANGAHLVIDYDGTIPAADLVATGAATGVTASVGPWPVTAGAVGHPKGGLIGGQMLSGRPKPDTAIDAITLQAGRWWQAPGEVVLDQDTAHLLDLGVGDTVTIYPQPAAAEKGAPPASQPDIPPGRSLTVVGIAASVSTPDVAAWMSPTDVTALAGGRTPAQQMLYRVDPAATRADLATATRHITSGLPLDAVAKATTYLDTKQGTDRLADLYVPVLLAFSIFALFAAAFTIVNVVSGIVLTGYREIGVMKAVGFTPGQVASTLVGQVLVPVSIGVVAGVVVGTLASQPIVRQTAMSFGLPAEFTFSPAVVVGVVGIVLLTALLAAVGPAIRAGAVSPATAITRGTVPSRRPDGGRLRRAGLGLPMPLPVRLGVAAGLAQPLRAAMTLGALIVGVVAVTFSVGLNASLLRVKEDLDRNVASPARGELTGDPGRAADVTAAFEANPDTAWLVSIGEAQVAVRGLGTVPFVGYDGESQRLGYAVIRGRWSTAPGEAVAPTNVFTQMGLEIGDPVTLTHDGRSVTVRLVGEIFDVANENPDDLVIRGSWTDLASLQPGVSPDRWEAAPRDGVAPRSYVSALQASIEPTAHVYLEGDSSSDESFLLFLSTVTVLGAVLVVVSIGGVFNTVLLETRQRMHELAVLKAIGLTPVEVIWMVVMSVVPVALLAGLVGVPLGLAAQRVVLQYMGHVAANLDIPAAEFDVFTFGALALLTLVGLGIGALGAFVPAQRAARAPIAPVLQAE